VANGRAGRPPTKAPAGSRTQLTLRLDAETKALIVGMADSYGLTVSEYVEVLASRDAGPSR